MRIPFALKIWELDDVGRGAKNPDLGGLTAATRKVAMFEETTIYRGYGPAGIQGLLSGPTHAPVSLGPDRSSLVESVESPLLALEAAGIGGPFALLLCTEPYRWMMAGEASLSPV